MNNIGRYIALESQLIWHENLIFAHNPDISSYILLSDMKTFHPYELDIRY